jgi:hypothetical protein
MTQFGNLLRVGDTTTDTATVALVVDHGWDRTSTGFMALLVYGHQSLIGPDSEARSSAADKARSATSWAHGLGNTADVRDPGCDSTSCRQADYLGAG